MTAWAVTRHPGALEWIAGQGLPTASIVAHLDPGEVKPGDIVIGTLPVNLAAEVCSRGARYLHLSMRISVELRGQELTADQMNEAGAVLEEFNVFQKHDSEFRSPKG